MKRRPRRKTAAVTKSSAVSREDALFARVVDIIEAARGYVTRSVNTAMVQAYWLVGREVVEVEQDGERRAGYGERVVEGLAVRLTAKFGKGFSASNLRNMRQFFLIYPHGSSLPEDMGGSGKRSALPSVLRSSRIRSAVPSESGAGKPRSAALGSSSEVVSALFPPSLGWTHYTILMRITNPIARAFYEIEAVRESWASRELERQVASLLFERLAKSRDKEKVLQLARKGHQVETAADVLKDPLVLEFLGLSEKSEWRERELEQAIIDRIEEFLLELGKGFCFVARQKRVTLEGDHFYVDLVFYNRLLRCFVLVDLKLGKLTHQDLGQIQMYVNFFDRFQRAEHEAKTIGIVLCSEKNDAMAKITLPEGNEQILAARYQMYLPTEAELRAELALEREQAERVLQIAAQAKGQGRGQG
jgi:predicted nuclease of restriction endonuclease-like (RecB) superfamily